MRAAPTAAPQSVSGEDWLVGLLVLLVPTLSIWLLIMLSRLIRHLCLAPRTQTSHTHVSLREQVSIYLDTSRLGRFLDSVQALFSLTSCFLYVIELYYTEQPDVLASFFTVEICFSSFFTLDYIFNFWLARDKLQFLYSWPSLVDLVTVLPVFGSLVLAGYSTVTYSFLKPMRALRALRILRAYRLLSFSRSDIQKQLMIIVLTIISIIVCTAGMLQYVENSALGRVPGQDGYLEYHQALYFVVITISTVGYGDITMESTAGRMIIMVMIFASFVLMPLQTSKLITLQQIDTAYLGRFNRDESYRHIVVSGDLTFDGLQDFLREFFHPLHQNQKAHVVIMGGSQKPSVETQMLLEHPYYENRVTYLRGSPMVQEDLKRAEAATAAGIVILTDKYGIKTEQKDAASLLYSLAVKDYAPSVPVLCQVHGMEGQQNLVVAAKVERSLSIQELRMNIMARNCVCPGFSTLFTAIARTFGFKPSSQHEQMPLWQQEYAYGCSHEIYASDLSKFVGRTFGEAANFVYGKHEVTFLGLETHLYDGASVLMVFPGKQYVIQEGDRGFFIAPSSEAVADLPAVEQVRFKPSSLKRSLSTATMSSNVKSGMVQRRTMSIDTQPTLRRSNSVSGSLGGESRSGSRRSSASEGRGSAELRTSAGMLGDAEPATVKGMRRSRSHAPSLTHSINSTSVEMQDLASSGSPSTASRRTKMGSEIGELIGIVQERTREAARQDSFYSKDSSMADEDEDTDDEEDKEEDEVPSGTMEEPQEKAARTSDVQLESTRATGPRKADHKLVSSLKNLGRRESQSSSVSFHDDIAQEIPDDSGFVRSTSQIGLRRPDSLTRRQSDSDDDDSDDETEDTIEGDIDGDAMHDLHDLEFEHVDAVHGHTLTGEYYLNDHGECTPLADASYINLDRKTGVANHVIVCGAGDKVNGLVHFVAALRSKHLPDPEFPAIVILSPNPPSKQQWRTIGRFPRVFYVEGEPTSFSDLEAAGIRRASRVVILANTLKNSHASDEFLVDAASIATVRAIESRPYVDAIVTAELVQSSNIKYLNRLRSTGSAQIMQEEALTEENKDEPWASLPGAPSSFSDLDKQGAQQQRLIERGNEIWRSAMNSQWHADYHMDTHFASGRVFCASVLDSILAQSFYSPYALPLLRAMVCGLPPVPELVNERDVNPSFVYQFPVPKEYIGGMYQHLFEDMMDNDILCLGMMRHPSHLEHSYMYINPRANTVLHAMDMLVVMTSSGEKLSQVSDHVPNTFNRKEMRRLRRIRAFRSR